MTTAVKPAYASLAKFGFTLLDTTLPPTEHDDQDEANLDPDHDAKPGEQEDVSVFEHCRVIHPANECSVTLVTTFGKRQDNGDVEFRSTSCRVYNIEDVSGVQRFRDSFLAWVCV